MTFVSIIGAGPGHPDYITYKGYQQLQIADVILYDALLEDSFQSIFPKSAKAVFVGKRCGAHVMTQERISQLIVDYAKEGNHVVRLKGGDPFVYGRGGEEVLALQENDIPFEVIPGLSAVNSVSAMAGIPATHRGVSDKLLILEGHNIAKNDSQWNFYAEFDGTIVIYMGTRSLQKIGKKLFDHGADLEKPIALIESGSFNSQHVQRFTLRDVLSDNVKKETSGPGLIIIGEVVNFDFTAQAVKDRLSEVS